MLGAGGGLGGRCGGDEGVGGADRFIQPARRRGAEAPVTVGAAGFPSALRSVCAVKRHPGASASACAADRTRGPSALPGPNTVCARALEAGDPPLSRAGVTKDLLQQQDALCRQRGQRPISGRRALTGARSNQSRRGIPLVPERRQPIGEACPYMEFPERWRSGGRGSGAYFCLIRDLISATEVTKSAQNIPIDLTARAPHDGPPTLPHPSVSTQFEPAPAPTGQFSGSLSAFEPQCRTAGIGQRVQRCREAGPSCRVKRCERSSAPDRHALMTSVCGARFMHNGPGNEREAGFQTGRAALGSGEPGVAAVSRTEEPGAERRVRLCCCQSAPVSAAARH
ncbi:hypothetical protein AOLI_G00040710 [Acnodon oligacanthus]